ncbi:hypothetical protein AB0M46_22930 [Dactylosporangium sp. NPDC051485]|uniref:hypothetical protein n=1 Tax=Dactylosporangium sp. NPDC051485 TaxID=3154846 RepID=UPI00342123E0
MTAAEAADARATMSRRDARRLVAVAGDLYHDVMALGRVPDERRTTRRSSPVSIRRSVRGRVRAASAVM